MGKVYLIGAGPGDPDLLTVKALRLLQNASVVLHDSLVSREVLALIPHEVELIDVGKRAGQKLLTQDEINALLVSYAGRGKNVIRLKGGDPLIFGRAGEEIEALRNAGVNFEVVPGITAALGAAAAAGISLTDRRAASQLVIATFSRGADASSMNWAAVTNSSTLVLYMPGADYAEVARQMRDAGLADDLPCVIVSNATTPRQQIRRTSVAALAQQEKLPAPALLIVGRVTAHHVDEIAEAYWPARGSLESGSQSARSEISNSQRPTSPTSISPTKIS
jgi:uroporphyrin-III C-methyltransferase